MISFFHVLILIKMLCTFYVLIGFFTRIVLLVLIVLQLFLLQNILKIHPSTFYEVEVNLMYLFIYIIIFFVGSGRYSVDRLIEKHHEKFQL
ncbi:TQO small subunit DoxD [Flavobacterium sp.]|uniref:TQO small subunit DoxD n=1 Tax=Flavobacterium sp. TaxID=239 RepID=UPI00338E0AE9